MAAVPGLTLSELVVPERDRRPPAPPCSRSWSPMVNGIAVDLWGNHDFVYSAEAELPAFRPAGVPGAHHVRRPARRRSWWAGSSPSSLSNRMRSPRRSWSTSCRPRAAAASARPFSAKGEELVADGGRTGISTYTEYPACSLRGDGPLIRPRGRPERRARRFARHAVRSRPRLPARPDRALERTAAPHAARPVRRAAGRGALGCGIRLPRARLVAPRARRSTSPSSRPCAPG